MKKHICIKNNKYLLSILVSATVVFPTLFFTPINKYIENKEDMWFNLYSLILPMLIISILLSILLYIILFFISKLRNEIFYKIICSILLSISFLCFIQNNYLNTTYGTGKLDGSKINWNNYLQYGIFNLAVWLIVTIIIVSLFLLTTKYWKNIMLIFSTILLVTQVITTITLNIMDPDDFNKKAYNISTDGIYELSSENNTLVFILDTLDYQVYKNYIENNPEAKETLTGFVEYSNALTAGSHTNVAIPAILTGEIKEPEEIINDFYNKAWENTEIYSDLSNNNVDTRLFIEAGHFGNQFDTTPFKNIESIEYDLSFYTNVISKLYKFSLFCEMPHFLKQPFYIETSDFSLKTKDNTFILDDELFFNNYRSQKFKISSEYSNSFRVYQLYGSHYPFQINEYGKKTYQNGSPIQTSIEEQTKGCFCVIQEMINDMNKKNIYDKANIVIMADHGKYQLSQHSTILIKEANNIEPYKVSEESISAFDVIPKLAKNILNKEYSFKYSTNNIEDNNRYFFLAYSKDKGYSINKYTTNTFANDLRHLFLKDYIYEEEITPKTIEKNVNYNFNNYEDIKNNIVTGYSTYNNEYSLSGPIIDIVLPISEYSNNDKLILNVSMVDKNQEYELYINGIIASKGNICENNQIIECDVSKEMINERNQLILRFNFNNIDINEFEKEAETPVKTIPMILNSIMIQN